MKLLIRAIALSSLVATASSLFANTFHAVLTSSTVTGLSATSATGPAASGTATSFAVGASQSANIADYTVGTSTVSTAAPNYIIAKFVEEYQKISGHSSDNYPTLAANSNKEASASYTIYFSTADNSTGTGTYNWKITATTVVANNGNTNATVTYTLATN